MNGKKKGETAQLSRRMKGAVEEKTPHTQGGREDQHQGAIDYAFDDGLRKIGGGE